MAHHLETLGVEWIPEHMVGVSENGLPLELPIEDGWPVEYRGVVDELPGLYFLGLAFQYSISSGEMSVVGGDTAYIADRIVRHQEEHTLAA